MANARKVAVKALTEVSNNKAYSNITLNKVFDNNPMNHTEKAFATALFYGVLDRKLSIDYIIFYFYSHIYYILFYSFCFYVFVS